jgi:hypothetical protein
MPCTRKTTTTPSPYDPHTPIADMEDAEKRFHVPATSLPGHGDVFLHLLRRRYTQSTSPYATPPCPLIRRHRKCQNTQRCKDHNGGSCPSHPAITVGQCGTNRGGINAPSAVDITQKNAEITSASPGSASALPGDIAGDWVLNHAHPQGVHRDSLGSFTPLPDLKAGETPALCAFFEHAASTTVLHVI